MLGRPGSWLPLWKNVMAGSWLIASVCSERMTQMSSAIPRVCGRRSLMTVPLLPPGLKAHLLGWTAKRACEATMPVMRWPRRIESGRSSLKRWRSTGLSSRRSRWEGPPDWKRQMTRFAFGAKCGRPGRAPAEEGETERGGEGETPLAAKASRPRSWTSAAVPRPRPVLARKSRREWNCS